MNGLEIAIVGMNCRMPGAPSVDAFWEQLRDGVEGVSFFDRRELASAGVPPRLLDDPQYVGARGVLDDIDRFDAEFFRFTREEAELADPQQRIFLECAWQALEDAACDPSRTTRAIGVYAGASANTYRLHLLGSGCHPDTLRGPHAIMGNEPDYLPTRVAYKLGLRGPAVAVQTACSSSLVAVHLACQGLLAGDCDVALAGGVSVAVPQRIGYYWEEGGIMSHDGHCRAFDARASGTVSGSGVGIVVLKRLADALDDRNAIRAVILGSAVNNDGADKIGYTAPSVGGQVAVIRTAHLRSEVAPETIGFVEAHGTGTALGDPIEIRALHEAFRSTQPGQRCAVGAVKTNIGHLDAAAGIAGLIKTVLVLEHGLIPPNLHYERPNPEIDFTGSRFYVPMRPTAWQREGDEPRRAAVTSLGIGGTNAHVVLEEAPQLDPSSPGRGLPVLTIAARAPESLAAMVESLAQFLSSRPDLDLFDAAYTLHVGRRHFQERAAVVCDGSADAATLLRGRAVSGTAKETTSVAFVLPGQGVERVGMAAELYDRLPTFRAQLDTCAELAMPHLGFDVRRILFPGAADASAAAQRLATTAVAQPVLFAVEYSLAQLWMKWGVRPISLIGHSLGEYVAACLAGVMSLDDALRVVCRRGQLMQEADAGGMLAVGMPAAVLEPRLPPSLSLAAVNSATLCVAAGPADTIAGLERELAREQIYVKRLRTSRAFHSTAMDVVVPRFARFMSSVRLRPPSIPYVSSATGTWIRDTEATDADYWAMQVRRPVMFGDGIRTILRAGCTALLDVGPGSTLLARVLGEYEEAAGVHAFASMGLTSDAGDDLATLHRTLADLWVHGAAIDWARYHDGERRRPTALPPYHFRRQRIWLTAADNRRAERPASSNVSDRTIPSEADADADALLIEEQIALMRQQLECLNEA